MIRCIVNCRLYFWLMLTAGIGLVLNLHFPFPDDNAILLLVAAEKPPSSSGLKYAYKTMLFSTPFIGASMLFSLLYIFVYIFVVRPQESIAFTPLPRNRRQMLGIGSFLCSASAASECTWSLSSSQQIHKNCHLLASASAIMYSNVLGNANLRPNSSMTLT